MLTNTSITLEQLANHLNAELLGDSAYVVQGCCSLNPGEPGKVGYLMRSAKPAVRQHLAHTRAGVVIIDDRDNYIEGTNALLVEKAELAFIQVARLFVHRPAIKGVHPTAVIAPSVSLGENVAVGAGCIIEDNVTIADNTVIMPGCYLGVGVSIGANCLLHPRVTCYHDVKMGDHVVIQSGAIIGAEGFGNVMHEGKWLSIPHSGSVVLEDDVQIGANTTIDRGVLDNTIIGLGVRIDNQIQIGHNVKIGAYTAIAAGTGIAGSTTIGQYCIIGGLVGIPDHVQIGDQVIILAKSAVTKSLPGPGIYSSAVPAVEASRWRRTWAMLRNIEKLKKRIKQLECQ